MDLTSDSFPSFKDPALPLFEGDDLRRLAQEITKAKGFLWQAQSIRYALQVGPLPCLIALAHPDLGPTPVMTPLPQELLHARSRNLGIFLHLLFTRSQLQKKNNPEPKVTLF